MSSYANKKGKRLIDPHSWTYALTNLVFLEAHHHELKDELVDGGCEGGEADENENERTDDVPGVELAGELGSFSCYNLFRTLCQKLIFL